MAKTRADKEAIVAKLATALKGSASTVFVHFKGLAISDEYSMRRALNELGVKYFITRKSLMRRAAQAAGIAGTQPELGGEMAIVYGVNAEAGTDVTLAPGSIQAYVRKLAGKMTIVGGISEGKFLTQAEMQALATVPSKDVLRGMFVNVINSPIQGLVVALNKIAENKA